MICNIRMGQIHLATNALKPNLMKTILSLLLMTVLSIQSMYATNLDDKNSKRSMKEVRKELTQLFNERSQDRPTHAGSVVAMVKVDAQGKGQVIEMDSDDRILQAYVKKQVETRNFQQLKNETIRLVVDFRN